MRSRRMRSRWLALALLCLLAVAVPASAQITVGVQSSAFWWTGTAVTVANTASATTLVTVPIPQGLIVAGVHCSLRGTISTISSPGTITLAAVYGAASAVNFPSAATPTGSMTTQPWAADIYLQQTTSASAQQLTGVFAGSLGASAAHSAYWGYSSALAQTPLGLMNLVVTWTWGTANAGNTITMSAASCAAAGA